MVISEACSPETVLDGGDLVLHHIGDLSITNTIPGILNVITSTKIVQIVYLYMIILAGRFPLISAYFLSALAMAGHMLSFNSWAGLVWRLGTLRYLVKVLFMLATTALTNLPF